MKIKIALSFFLLAGCSTTPYGQDLLTIDTESTSEIITGPTLIVQMSVDNGCPVAAYSGRVEPAVFPAGTTVSGSDQVTLPDGKTMDLSGNIYRVTLESVRPDFEFTNPNCSGEAVLIREVY